MVPPATTYRGRVGDRSWLYRHRVAVDVAIATFFVVLDTGLTLIGGSWWPHRPGPLAWVLLVLQAVACFSLVARRRYPLTVVAILAAYTLVVSLAIWPLGLLVPVHADSTWAPFATVLAAYAPVASCRDRRVAIAAIVVLAVIVAWPWHASVMTIVIGLLRTGVGPLLALYFEARRQLVRALTERAERAERERHLLAEQARAEERARLAGEMHDVVTHRVTLMVLQAGALRMTATDEPTRQAAEELREAGCQALDELRDLVGVLRTGPAEEQLPSASDFAALVAESTAAGTPTELDSEGDPALASPVVRRTAYRIVREALTNVRKHAPGARAVVRVRYDHADGVRITVRNTAPAGRPDPALAGTGSGLGLAGLRGRIEVVHGTLSAAPGPDGGFCLDATLPAYVPTAEPAG